MLKYSGSTCCRCLSAARPPSCPVPIWTRRASIVSGVRVLVRAAVNHLGTVFPVVRLASIAPSLAELTARLLILVCVPGHSSGAHSSAASIHCWFAVFQHRMQSQWHNLNDRVIRNSSVIKVYKCVAHLCMHTIADLCLCTKVTSEQVTNTS